MSDATYTKDELKSALRFKDKRDVLDALLDKDKEYTVKEAEEIIREFLEGCV